jgi:hypothetical protein
MAGPLLRNACAICKNNTLHIAQAKCQKWRVEMRVKELVRELMALPFRQNTIEAQRRTLGLSRATLARILEVDPSTVYRQELQNPMSMLWYYALRGLAAEAADKDAKRIIREHKANLARSAEIIGAERLDAGGYKLTAERMREAEREQAKPKKARPPAKSSQSVEESSSVAYKPRHRPRGLTRAQIKEAADRAEARSKDAGR